MVSNPFDSGPVARRYVDGRPYYHPAALDLAAEWLPISRVPLALDFGCGTGLSSRAVRERADQVVAIDPSLAMLRAAESLVGVCYVAAGAERIPLPDAAADLATAGAAFHWCDPAQALGELARVLRPGAALIVYSDFLNGRLTGNPEFAEWLENSYLSHYPPPARHAYFDPDAAEAAGFDAPWYAEDDLVVPLTGTQLANYLLSQSGAATAIESGRVSADTLQRQIIDELQPLFRPGDEPAAVELGIRAWITVRRR